MAAPEKTAIRTSTRPLVDGLAVVDILSIADDLKGNNLISDDVYQGLRLPTKTKKDQARDVVNNVTGKVNANTENFVKFIKVLKDNELSELVKLLEDRFVENGGDISSLRQATQANGAQGVSESSAAASSSLTVDNLPDVHKAVYPARVKWHEIGMGLKVDIGTLDAIKEDEISSDKRLQKTLQEWLQNGTDRSWAALKKALESPIVGRKDIASKLPPS